MGLSKLPKQGVSFEDWASACGNLVQGMPESEIARILGITEEIWQEVNEQWTEALGELIAEDPNIATTYSEIFANPKVGKFLNQGTPSVTLQDVLAIAPDYTSYQGIFWHQAIGSQHGVDPQEVLKSYGLDIAGWGILNSHYIKDGLNALESPTLWDALNLSKDERFQRSEERRLKEQEIKRMMKCWENHWREYYEKR